MANRIYPRSRACVILSSPQQARAYAKFYRNETSGMVTVRGCSVLCGRATWSQAYLEASLAYWLRKTGSGPVFFRRTASPSRFFGVVHGPEAPYVASWLYNGSWSWRFRGHYRPCGWPLQIHVTKGGAL